MMLRLGLPLTVLAICLMLILASAYLHLFDPEFFGAYARIERLEEGRGLYRKYDCHRCHGPEGGKPVSENYPRLDGQSAHYLVQQLRDIRSGARSNGTSAIMRGLLIDVSDEEIELIAAFLSSVR